MNLQINPKNTINELIKDRINKNSFTSFNLILKIIYLL